MLEEVGEVVAVPPSAHVHEHQERLLLKVASIPQPRQAPLRRDRRIHRPAAEQPEHVACYAVALPCGGGQRRGYVGRWGLLLGTRSVQRVVVMFRRHSAFLPFASVMGS
ncbi:MAG: hypothetical protein WKH64_13285 [Chloroflexia bacterium]